MTNVRRWIATLGAWLGLLPLLGAGPTARWIGQDGHDLVDKAPEPRPSGVQDLHFVLEGLPPGAKIVAGKVRADGGGEWTFGGPPGSWLALAVQPPGGTRADVYVEPYQVETGRWFDFQVVFADGRDMTIRAQGGKADPNLRTAAARFEARWVGQDRRDLVGPSPNAGPDGVQDVHIALAKLAAKEEVRSILITGPGDLRWQYGPNAEAHPRAELVRHPSEPGRADLYLQSARDLAGKPLKLALTYADGKTDEATVPGGKCDPALKMPHGASLSHAPLSLKATWLGQGGGAERGHVRVGLDGLPRGGRIVGVDLSDGEVAGWSDRSNGDVSDALPLTLRRGSDPTKGELSFPPVRVESGATMMLRLLFADGRSAVGSFPSGACDPSLRAEGPAGSSVVAKPGDDLNDLANRHGTVNLSTGTYTLNRPLVLNRPVTITSTGGATIVFAQAAGEPAWKAAVEIHAGRTTLDGFALRFAGPVRWDASVAYGPAVIGTAHEPGRVLAGLTFTRLEIQGPPPASAWEEAPKTLRLVEATNGTITRCGLQGGMIELWGGPWRIGDNAFDGPPAGTFAHALIAVHEPHDLSIEENKVHQLDPRGKAWRWLVLANRGSNVRVVGNSIEGVGPRDADVHPHPNAPETILTESYRLDFEGKTSGMSTDGRVLAIPGPQGPAPRVGAVVAILSGPEAGTWRRVVLPLGGHSFLLDRPVALGGGAVAIGPGFVSTSFERNVIDDHGSKVAMPFVLAGQHFGTRVVGNTTKGGGVSARIVATGTEAPGPWGWSHTAMFGLTIEGNTFEDAREGALLIVEHNTQTRHSRGRVYVTASLVNNTFAAPSGSIGLTVGEPAGGDPGALIVSESGNRARGRGLAARVRMATINGKMVREGTINLPSEPGAAAGPGLPARR
jgi:hypothetical protein